MIEVEGLTKFYGHVSAIKDVSFNVEKGEILGFLGPNAAGKTTTMRILTCFMPPTSGSAKIVGHDIFSYMQYLLRMHGVRCASGTSTQAILRQGIVSELPGIMKCKNRTWQENCHGFSG